MGKKVDDLNKDNDILLKHYVGQNYDKITKKTFNFSAFFLTSIYMFYRKMYLYAIITFLTELLPIFVFNNAFLGLFVNILIGLFFNKIYILYAKEKIEKIKLNSKDKSINELESICKFQGGVSSLGLFIGLLLELLISGICIIVLVFVFNYDIKSIIPDIKKKTPEMIERELADKVNEIKYNPGSFNGTVYYTSDTIIKDNFDVNPPSIFTDLSEQEHLSYSYEAGDGIFNECKFNFGVVDGFKPSDNLINQMATFYKDSNPSEVKKETINNINWNWFGYDTNIGRYYYYLTVKDNKVYLLNYLVQSSADDSCEANRVEVLKGITSK